MLLISARPAVLKWIQEVAQAGDAYKNPEFVCTFFDLPAHTGYWGDEDKEVDKKAEGKAGDGDSEDEDKKEEGRINVRLRDVSLKD